MCVHLMSIGNLRCSYHWLGQPWKVNWLWRVWISCRVQLQHSSFVFKITWWVISIPPSGLQACSITAVPWSLDPLYVMYIAVGDPSTTTFSLYLRTPVGPTSCTPPNANKAREMYAIRGTHLVLPLQHTIELLNQPNFPDFNQPRISRLMAQINPMLFDLGSTKYHSLTDA